MCRGWDINPRCDDGRELSVLENININNTLMTLASCNNEGVWLIIQPGLELAQEVIAGGLISPAGALKWPEPHFPCR